MASRSIRPSKILAPEASEASADPITRPTIKGTDVDAEYEIDEPISDEDTHAQALSARTWLHEDTASDGISEMDDLSEVEDGFEPDHVSEHDPHPSTPMYLPTIYQESSKGLSTQSLEDYIRFANQIPTLSAEEEHALAIRLHETGDVEAAQKLVLSHLKFVVKIAKTLSGYGLNMGDLIQEGNIGLMKAVKRFNPHQGVRLVTFAVHWIKSEMHEFVIKNWRIVKVATTKAQRKLFFNLRSSKRRLGWFSKEEVQEVADELNVKPHEVLEMEARMNAHDMAFDAPETADEDSHAYSAPEHTLPSTLPTPEEAYDQEISGARDASLQEALEQLSPRDRDIITSRWLVEEKATLHELAERYQISAERVRQIETQILKKLKTQLSDSFDDE